VQAGGADVDVPGYSVPSAYDWNNDGLQDLIVGEGSGSYTPKVRVYLNAGAYDGEIRLYINASTNGTPNFPAQTFAQDNSSNLSVPGGRSSPAVYDLNDDVFADLLIGASDGKVHLYRGIPEPGALYVAVLAALLIRRGRFGTMFPTSASMRRMRFNLQC